MSSQRLTTRAGVFVRSVLPAEPAHWLILVGSILLFISHYLRWWPDSGLLRSLHHFAEWYAYVGPATLLFTLGGAIGLYMCLVRCSKQNAYPLIAVLLPGTFVLVVIAAAACHWFAGLDSVQSALLNVTGQRAPGIFASMKPVTELGPGFEFAALGLLFMACFVVLVHYKRASVPVRLAGSGVWAPSSSWDENAGHRTMLFVWMMIALTPLLGLVDSTPLYVLRTFFSDFAKVHGPALVWALRTWGALFLFLLVLWAIGPDRRRTLRESHRPPSWKYLALGMLFPVAVASIWPALVYSYDRSQWAIYDIGSFMPPNALKYFAWPTLSSSSLLLGAFIEEIAWRGFLQPRFIRRYGFARGVFLVAIVWTAFHFAGDFNSGMTAAAVGLDMLSRFSLLTAQSFVLAWLTIRSRSVVPAALMHAGYNALYFAYVGTAARAPFLVTVALWATLAIILFRYFPLESIDEDAQLDLPQESEAAF